MGRDPSPLEIVFLFIIGIFGGTVAFGVALLTLRTLYRAAGWG
jgi:hypothetical protein